jgi:hypothetical protein
MIQGFPRTRTIALYLGNPSLTAVRSCFGFLYLLLMHPFNSGCHQTTPGLTCIELYVDVRQQKDMSSQHQRFTKLAVDVLREKVLPEGAKKRVSLKFLKGSKEIVVP